jgi:glycosyltransferase involved in cell wall biosynthesis
MNKQLYNLKLVKIGSPGLEADRIKTLDIINELGLQKDVIFTGFIPEVDLPIYYSNAACFILPSLYEGFGLPLLEAMACGCPVIASNITSIPEVVGNAGILVNSQNIKEIASAIEQVLFNEKIREELIEKGFEQCRKFSWDRTAIETSRIYESLK